MNNLISFSTFLRLLGICFALTLLLCCNAGSTTQSDYEYPDSTKQFLLISAATDFIKYQKIVPADFRNLKLGYLGSEEQLKTPILCGEYSIIDSTGNETWYDFATIQTSGYEQYIGNNSILYCQQATFSEYHEDSLSLSLKAAIKRLKSGS